MVSPELCSAEAPPLPHLSVPQFSWTCSKRLLGAWRLMVGGIKVVILARKAGPFPTLGTGPGAPNVPAQLAA